ncbi:MAG: FliH/SctL family protein [Sedimentibacter sp.]
MSNIIKSKYVVLDNKSIIQTNAVKKLEQPEPHGISTPREDLYEIYNQREIILKEANEEALKIINSAKRNAQKDIAECKKRGYEEGYNAGMEVGKNKGYAEGYETGKISVSEKLQAINENKLKELAEMLEKIEEEKESIITKYEIGLSNLAIEIAEKILRHKIEAKDNLISGIIKNVIKDYRNVEWIKIFISSKDDIISVQADKDLISELNKISKDVKFQVSEDLIQGSAIVETPDSIVDASIDTQLKNFKEMVLSKNAV